MTPKSHSNEHLQGWILAIGALVLSALVGSTVYDSWRLHDQLETSNHRALGNLARALANEARRNFQSVDLLLTDTADWYEETGHTLKPMLIQQELAARALGLGQVSVLTIVDAQGMQTYRSRDTGEPLSSVADRQYFKAQRDSKFVGLYVNEPIVTRTEKLPSLVISRRLNGPNGVFAGVVTAIVTLDEFQEMYATLQMNEGSALLLTLNDGTLITRNPPLAGGLGSVKFPEIPLLKDGELIDRAISPLDGRVKLIAALPVGDLPLVVAMTRDEEKSLAPWYDEMHSAAIRTTLLSLLIMFTIYGLLRQLRKAEASAQALSLSEERYAMTMDAADGGHGEWNIREDTLFLSDKWRAMHGIGKGSNIQTARDLVACVPLHADDMEAVKRAVEAHLAGQSPHIEIEYRTLHSDGKWHWIHARAKSLLNDQGACIRLFCAAADVTERRETLAAKLEWERRLQQTQRLESLGMLAGGIAHDFNNILGAILGFGEMALQKSEPGSDMQRYLSRVMQAGDRARLLVRRILDFSRSGVVEHSPVHIQSVVEEALAMLLPTVPPGIAVKTDFGVGNAAVRGDATQLYQVATNLCTNGLQAMGDSGVLLVRLYLQDISETKILVQGNLSAGSYVCLEVADTGTGIAPEVMQSMFNPFFTTKKGCDGTGLGLSVVHGVVADHAGAIDVVSKPGVGTVMSVWLPTQGNCDTRFAKTAPHFVYGSGQTVMIVDDEVPLVELAEELLASLGYEPVGFHTAEAALQAFRADPSRFDMVLTDEMLPGMAGSELAAQIRVIQPLVVIAIMSGKVTPDLEARARDAGVHTLLHKPLQLSDIASALARALTIDTDHSDATFAKPHH